MTAKVMADIEAADLFCGAGGSSTGLILATQLLGRKVHLRAVNHWKLAIETHSLNHPYVDHFNSDLETLDPLDAVPEGFLDLLVASPECTHHSRARGGKPMSDQSRTSAKYITKWTDALNIIKLMIENVPEFEEWGPLHNTHSKDCPGNDASEGCIKGCQFHQPIKARRGQYFKRFVKDLEERGYKVEHRVLCCADYGDVTTRKRLFLLCRKDGKPITWPLPTYARDPEKVQQQTDMFQPTMVFKRWRAAAEIIRWEVLGKSIFNRKKPLVANTMRRISAGFWEFGGRQFLLGQQSGAAPRTLDQPVPTIASAGAISLTTPYIAALEHSTAHGSQIRSIEQPFQTITGQSRFAIGQGFLVSHHGERPGQGERIHSLDNPMPTIAGSPTLGLAQPFITAVNHGKDIHRNQSINSPLPTVTGVDAMGFVQPFMTSLRGTGESQINSSHFPIWGPVPTLTASGGHIGLTEPYFAEYYGTGGATSVIEPLKTQTGKDRFLLVEPWLFKDQSDKIWMLDVLYRMLLVEEMAAATGFGTTYIFAGKREDQVKQIGNAVPVYTAKALCTALLQ